MQVAFELGRRLRQTLPDSQLEMKSKAHERRRTRHNIEGKPGVLSSLGAPTHRRIASSHASRSSIVMFYSFVVFGVERERFLRAVPPAALRISVRVKYNSERWCERYLSLVAGIPLVSVDVANFS
jgi:hypothetical protein